MQAISLHNTSARLASARRPAGGRAPAKVAANANKVQCCALAAKEHCSQSEGILQHILCANT